MQNWNVYSDSTLNGPITPVNTLSSQFLICCSPVVRGTRVFVILAIAHTMHNL